MYSGSGENTKERLIKRLVARVQYLGISSEVEFYNNKIIRDGLGCLDSQTK